MRSLSIFGATGSVGEQTVDLLRRASPRPRAAGVTVILQTSTPSSVGTMAQQPTASPSLCAMKMRPPLSRNTPCGSSIASRSFASMAKPPSISQAVFNCAQAAA